MLEGKKKDAAVRGARKLVEMETPDDEILATLEELGITGEDAKAVMAEAKRAPAQGEPPKVAPEKKEEVKQQEVAAPEAAEEAEPRAPIRREKKAKKEESFWKKMLPVKRDYIPRLRTGGKAKVKEIIVASPLDKE